MHAVVFAALLAMTKIRVIQRPRKREPDSATQTRAAMLFSLAQWRPDPMRMLGCIPDGLRALSTKRAVHGPAWMLLYAG
jgi:hypothetical protein